MVQLNHIGTNCSYWTYFSNYRGSKMINTLKELVESINENLKTFEGTNVSGPLDVCREVKQQIQADKFYEDLRKNNLEDLIVFENSIDRLDCIYLRSHVGDPDPRPIIKINISISYFDETNFRAGGVLTAVNCALVETGKKLEDLPLNKVVLIMRFSDAKSKSEQLGAEIAALEERIIELRDEKTKIDHEVVDLKEEIQNS